MLEVGNNRAKISFEVAELDTEVIIHGTLGIIWCELSVACEIADALLISDIGATGHILERIADTDNGEHKEVSAVLNRSLLILFE